MNDNTQNQAPMHARARNPDLDDTQLSVNIPKWLMGVIDAEQHARGSGSSRKEVVIEVLETWARRRIHEATVLLRLTEGNQSVRDSGEQRNG